MSRLVQILGEGVEELWEFPDNTTDKKIKEWYNYWEGDDNYDSFEELMQNIHPEIECQRLFVDEINV